MHPKIRQQQRVQCGAWRDGREQMVDAVLWMTRNQILIMWNSCENHENRHHVWTNRANPVGAPQKLQLWHPSLSLLFSSLYLERCLAFWALVLYRLLEHTKTKTVTFSVAKTRTFLGIQQCCVCERGAEIPPNLSNIQHLTTVVGNPLETTGEQETIWLQSCDEGLPCPAKPRVNTYMSTCSHPCKQTIHVFRLQNEALNITEPLPFLEKFLTHRCCCLHDGRASTSTNQFPQCFLRRAPADCGKFRPRCQRVCRRAGPNAATVLLRGAESQMLWYSQNAVVITTFLRKNPCSAGSAADTIQSQHWWSISC